MKSQEPKEKKQFRELSDEELKNVTGGERIITIDLGELARSCSITSCPPGYQLDLSLEPCQCVTA